MLIATAEATPKIEELPSTANEADFRSVVAAAARKGLTADPRTLPPWLFYDELGSYLFEQITALPEYYLTRTERSILAENASDILRHAAGPEAHPLTLLELGAGTAAKTGILLAAAVQRQGSVLYQPIDVSSTALEQARENIQKNIQGVTVHPQVANYATESLLLNRPPNARILALYIGSSIGNFAPAEAENLLRNLRAQLQPGDSLLLGADLAPGSQKTAATLLAAYDDAAGITAAFNRNILVRLNREIGTDFRIGGFRHNAVWNEETCRIEMHLLALSPQAVHLPADPDGPAVTLGFAPGDTIHTENSYKFTTTGVNSLLAASGFKTSKTWYDDRLWFAVTLATAA